MDQVPGSLWDIDRMLASGLIPVDMLVARMHAAGKPGILSYGQMVGYSASAIAAAARVCFEVTPACPGPAGPTVPTARADVVYHYDVTGPAGTGAGRAASPSRRRSPARSLRSSPTAPPSSWDSEWSRRR